MNLRIHYAGKAEKNGTKRSHISNACGKLGRRHNRSLNKINKYVKQKKNRPLKKPGLRIT